MQSSTTMASLGLNTDVLYCRTKAFAQSVRPVVWSILEIIFISLSLAKAVICILTIQQAVRRNVSMQVSYICFIFINGCQLKL